MQQLGKFCFVTLCGYWLLLAKNYAFQIPGINIPVNNQLTFGKMIKIIIQLITIFIFVENLLK